MILKPGDRINCLVKDYNIVSPYSSYDYLFTFEIIAKESNNIGYHVYVPNYIIIKNSIKADQYFCNEYNINKKFLNEQTIFVKELMISKVSYILDGSYCKHCKDFFDWAENNQEDGSFLCWSCKQNPYR